MPYGSWSFLVSTTQLASVFKPPCFEPCIGFVGFSPLHFNFLSLENLIHEYVFWLNPPLYSHSISIFERTTNLSKINGCKTSFEDFYSAFTWDEIYETFYHSIM